MTLYDNITADQHSTLAALEVKFQEDLGNFTYLCCYERTSLEPLRALEWVRQVDVYRNKFKSPEELQSYLQTLKDSPQGGDDDTVVINVMPHPEYDNADGLQELAVNVAATAGVNLDDVDKLPDVDVEAQGFGRINLLASIAMLEEPPILASPVMEIGVRASMSHGTMIGDALKDGDVFEITLTPKKQSQPTDLLDFKVTLVYNDMRGAEVQNNLNLSVVGAVTGYTTYGYESQHDMRVQNNVEQVVLLSVSANPVIIRVNAEKIFPEQTQDFILAWALIKPYNGFSMT